MGEIISVEVIATKILEIRGKKVMLDRDLAQLYGVGTRNLNKAVKRNLERFPEDFMFQLTQEEFENLMFQNGTSRWGGTRKLSYAFTEQGVAMLSSVLNSERAIQVNIHNPVSSLAAVLVDVAGPVTGRLSPNLARGIPVPPAKTRLTKIYLALQ